MISKKILVLWLILLPLFLPAQDRNWTASNFLTFDGALRPVLFRSEFVSSGTLRNLQKYSAMEGYDSFGFPQFKNVVIKRDLRFWETKLAQTRYYARYLNREFKSYILEHPDQFHPDTIRDYAKGLTSRNPKLADGTPLQWHHGKDGYELVPVTEHGKTPHIGGANTYGYKIAEASRKIPHREMILTAQRWGKFAALDLALSSAALAVEGEKDWKTYTVNAAASATAGAVAWGLESLLVTSFPLLQGSTPIFVGGMAINLGGPASWIATGSFILTKYAIMAGWKQYQLEMAKEVEERCQEAEKTVRFNMLKKQAEQNTAQLQALLSDF